MAPLGCFQLRRTGPPLLAGNISLILAGVEGAILSAFVMGIVKKPPSSTFYRWEEQDTLQPYNPVIPLRLHSIKLGSTVVWAKLMAPSVPHRGRRGFRGMASLVMGINPVRPCKSRRQIKGSLGIITPHTTSRTRSTVMVCCCHILSDSETWILGRCGQWDR